MAIESKSFSFGDAEFAVVRLPPHLAFNVGCVALQWRARLDGIKFQGVVDRSRVGLALGAGIELRAQMFANSDFKRDVFNVVIDACTFGGQPVRGKNGVWNPVFDGDNFGNIVRLFDAALEYCCGSFFLAIETPLETELTGETTEATENLTP